MYDNKIRLSQDVLDKAALIASEWGLKNPRAAVEAVFRRYADDYLSRSQRSEEPMPAAMPSIGLSKPMPSDCEALSELDDLLGF